MKMPTLLERLLPFPVHLPEEVEALDLASPDDLADPHLAEAILNAVMDGALAQGADPRGAAWYASLVAGALTGWSVSVVPPPEVEQAYSHTFDPSGIFTMRGHLAPDWEALLGDGAFLQALEEAWVVARDMGRGRLLSVAEAAALVGIPAEELARRLERGEVPRARQLGRAWLVPRDALGDLETTDGGR